MKKIKIDKTKKIGKYSMVFFAILLSSVLVTGGLISYFGKIETTATAVQPITIDNKPYNDMITHTINPAYGGCCYCFKHTLRNKGCNDITVDWQISGTPDLDGITVSFHEDCECKCTNPVLVFPRVLHHGETLEVCVCYGFDVMILPGVYTIGVKLIAVQS